MKINKKVAQAMLTLNTQTQPKAKYSNNVLLAMLEKANDNFEAEVEGTRSGFAMNRGSLCECLVKHIILKQDKIAKAQSGESDLNTLKVDLQRLAFYGLPKSKNIEVKFSTSFAPATAKTSKARYVLIIAESGAYLVNACDIIPTGAGKININNQSSKTCKRLDNLSKDLGL